MRAQLSLRGATFLSLLVLGAFASVAFAATGTVRPGAGTSVRTDYCDPGLVGCSPSGTMTSTFILTGTVPFGPPSALGRMRILCTTSSLSPPPISCTFTGLAWLPGGAIRANDSGTCILQSNLLTVSSRLLCTDAQRSSWRITVQAQVGSPLGNQTPVNGSTPYHGIYELNAPLTQPA